ncbi:MAG: phytanoyl-CoA dioxygenase [Hyphomicrobiales bacterium]|nr:MAG: phytanoyl-CoA dioxygenase [Hyphomicrobiales bacterium]
MEGRHGDVQQAVARLGLRRHRQPALLSRQHDDAARRREEDDGRDRQGHGALSAAVGFARSGFEVFTDVVSEERLASLRALPAFACQKQAGARGFDDDALVSELACAFGPLGLLAAKLLGATARPVRILFFDKSEARNWAVPWHQDRTIAVAEQHELAGFGPWSLKGGVPHVEPPSSLLAEMAILRLHLDDCGEQNGPLMVIDGSWRKGRVPTSQIQDHLAPSQVRVLVASAGDVVVMRGLTIHASERARYPSRRRVIHVEYSARDLPKPLRWHGA